MTDANKDLVELCVFGDGSGIDIYTIHDLDVQYGSPRRQMSPPDKEAAERCTSASGALKGVASTGYDLTADCDADGQWLSRATESVSERAVWACDCGAGKCFTGQAYVVGH
jgi:hypothetical protein